MATVEFGGPAGERDSRLAAAAELAYNDLAADRQTVAAVQAMEAILAKHAAGTPNCVVEVNQADWRTGPADRRAPACPKFCTHAASVIISPMQSATHETPARHANVRSRAEAASIEHRGRRAVERLRRRAAAVEPAALRTFTPSLAVIARSEGCYHWTPEGRKLADFTSGVLVANLGHNPDALVATRAGNTWACSAGAWPTGDGFFSALPLTAYNALTELEVQAAERLVATMRRQAGRRADGASAVGGQRQRGDSKSALGGARYRRPGERPRSDSGHALRLSRQEGAGRRRHRQRATIPSATRACASSAFRAKSASTSPAGASRSIWSPTRPS